MEDVSVVSLRRQVRSWWLHSVSTVLPIVLLVAACTSSPAVDGTVTVSSQTTAVTIRTQCSDQDVGTDPPQSVRFVGETDQVVPFQSWSCPGYDADSFSDPGDFPVTAKGGKVDVYFESGPATRVSAVAWTISEPRSDASLEVDEIGEGHVRFVVPDPDVAWVIRVRLATVDGRVAYYDALLEPFGTADPPDYVPSAEEQWLLDTLNNLGFVPEVAQANQGGQRAEIYIDINEHNRVFVTSQPQGTPAVLAESLPDVRVALLCGDREIYIETETSWNWALHVVFAIADDLACTASTTMGIWPVRTLDEFRVAAGEAADGTDHDVVAVAFIREVLGWEGELELPEVYDGTDSMGFVFEVDGRRVYIGSETIYALNAPVTLVSQASTMDDLGEFGYLSASVRQEADEWIAEFYYPEPGELTEGGRPAISMVSAEMRYGDKTYRSESSHARFVLEAPPVIPGSLTIEYRDASGRIIDYRAVRLPPGSFAAG